MIERRAIGLGLIALAGLLLPGHSPYTQWYAYRAKHLVVVTDGRPGALDLAQAVAAQARSAVEAVRLVSSGQLQVALVPSAAAFDASQGQGSFAADGKLPLRAIAALGDEVLVVLDTYPRERARTLPVAIADSAALSSRAAGGKPRIPYHPGVSP